MKKFFKFIMFSVIGLIVLVVVISMLGGEDTTTTSSTGTKVGESKATEEKKVEDKTFKVGDTIDLDGLEVTIASATYINASEYTPATKGKVLQMGVNVTNNSDNKVFFDSSEFNMYDKDGNALEAYFGGDDLDISGDINKGKKLSGTLTYDVPEGSNYELIYEPTFSWTEQSITWNIVPR